LSISLKEKGQKSIYIMKKKRLTVKHLSKYALKCFANIKRLKL